jgi:hypothetical protein
VSSDGCIIDTVILLYFLLVGRAELLRELVGDPMMVPVSVYDPADRSLSPEALRRSEFLSEIRQAVRHFEAAVRIGTATPQQLDRMRAVDHLFDAEHLRVVQMVDDEPFLAAQLQSQEAVRSHGVQVPLGPGEAACVAISFKRGWTIATDDDAALTVLESLHGGEPFDYERIRKLLIRAANEKRLTQDEANSIHAEMRGLGFWDKGRPFT